MPYTAQITRANPTLVVFLIDQSGSMADPSGGEQSARNRERLSREGLTIDRLVYDRLETLAGLNAPKTA